MRTANMKTLKSAAYFHGGAGFPRAVNPLVYFAKSEGKRFAYSPLYNESAALSRAEYAFITKNPIVYEDLPRKYARFAKSFLYVKNRKVREKNHEHKQKVETLSIITTSLCNLRCKYCFAFGGEGNSSGSQKNHAKTPSSINTLAVLSIIRKLKPTRLLLFGWGEPTLALKAIKQICDSSDAKGLEMTMITNGVYYSKRSEIIKYLVRRGIKLQISLDGDPSSNDLNRVTADGRGSSEEILKTIAEIKKYGTLSKFADVRVTVCKGMEGRLLRNMIYLSKLGFRKIGFEPVELSGRAVGNVSRVDLNVFATNMVEAVVFGKMHGIEVISRVLPSAKGRVMARHGCGFVGGSAISLALDNSLYLCDDAVPELKIGFVSKKQEGKYTVSIDRKKLAEIISKEDLIGLKECEDCPVKCGGGCAKESLETYGELGHGGESKAFCEARRLALFEYIKTALKS